MQSINVNIEGDFWDSFIYKGRLFLFNFNNGVKICDWDLICEYISSKTNCHLGVYYGLQRGNKLYVDDIMPHELERVKYEFDILSKTTIYISKIELQQFILREIDSPFLEISNDIEVFNNILYCASDRGLESFQLLFEGESPLIEGEKANTIWDSSIISISASHGGRMALSLGDEGLYEYLIGNFFYEQKRPGRISHLSNKHSSFADWNFSSLYNSSDEGDSYLSVYQRVQKDMLSHFNFRGFDQIESKDAKFLKFKRDITQEEIFSVDKKHLSWGFGNKMYCWDKNSLIVNDFKQYAVNNGDENSWLGDAKKIQLDLNSTELVVNGGVSFFGVIVELEKRLLVVGHGVNDELSYMHIEAPITKWRIFPRSQRYENQMHIVFDDYLRISAVTNDYFGRKTNKDLGLKYNTNV